MPHTTLKSMTGFGSAQDNGGDAAIGVEIRCVNNRGLKLSVKARPSLGVFEKALRDQVAASLTRGSVEVFVTLRRPPAAVDETLLESAKAKVGAVQSLAVSLGLPVELTARDLLLLPGLFDDAGASTAVTEAEWEAIARVLATALGQVAAMRETEGAALAAALERLAPPVEIFAQETVKLSAAAVERARERIRARLAEWFPNGITPGDTQALEREAALIADKADVREELDRLASHLTQYRALLSGGGDAGKRLEFLAQEMLREVNTAATKAQDAEVSTLALSAKLAIEQMKEQAANVE